MINIIGHIKQLFVKYPYLTIGLFVSVFFIVCAYVLPIQFEENDDITMLLLASGKYSGSPQAHLNLINILLGLFLNFWYLSIPMVEWYTLWFAIFHIISITIIIKKIVFTDSFFFIPKLAFLAILLLFEAYFIINFQFTTTAILIGLSAFCLYFSEEKTTQSMFISALLLVLSSLIRFQATMLILIFASPFILNQLIKKQIQLRFILIVFISIMFCFYLNISSYKYSSWKSFLISWQSASKIMDNPHSDIFINTITKEQERNDFLLYQIGLIDCNIMNNKVLFDISSKVNTYNLKLLINEMIFKLKSLLIGDLNRLLPPIYSLLLFLFVLLWYSKNDMCDKITMILIFGIFMLLLCYIPIFLTLKSRVFFSMIFIVFILFIFHFKSSNSFIESLLVVFMLYYFSDYITRINRDTRKYNDRKREIFVKQKSLFDKHDGKIISLGGTIIYEGGQPFAISTNWKSQKMYSMALASSPLNNKICNTYKELVNGPAIFMDLSSVAPVSSLLIHSIKVHYNINAKYKIVEQDSLSAIVQFYK